VFGIVELNARRKTGSDISSSAERNEGFLGNRFQLAEGSAGIDDY
jgi:hypothetical protein